MKLILLFWTFVTARKVKLLLTNDRYCFNGRQVADRQLSIGLPIPPLPSLLSPSASAYANSGHSHRLLFSAAAIAALTKLPQRVAARPEPIRCQKQQN